MQILSDNLCFASADGGHVATLKTLLPLVANYLSREQFSRLSTVQKINISISTV